MSRKYFVSQKTIVTKKESFDITVVIVSLLMMMTGLCERQLGLKAMIGYAEGCTVRYRTINMRIQPNMSIQQRRANENWGEERDYIFASDEASGIESNDRGKLNKKFFEQDLLSSNRHEN